MQIRLHACLQAVALAATAALSLAGCGGGGADAQADAAAAAGAASAAQREGPKTAQATALPGQGRWSAPIALSLVPASAANLPDGRLLLWSAQDRFGFNTASASTYTAIFDPATGTSVERRATETDHNMFCPGTANLPDGRILVSGGSSSGATSLYDPATDRWTRAQAMNIPRAYHATVPLADGSVLALGGSWNGGQGNKHAELWTEAGGWRRLTGVPVTPMIGPDPAGVYRGDNHMWLIPTGNGRVLHAGPSAAMNWIDTRGSGATVPAGPRGDDRYAINGSTVMFEAGRVLKTGGAPAYENVDATNGAQLIDTRGGGVGVRRLAPMAYARAFHNSVVLPNGQVIVVGGQTYPVPYSDSRSVLVPELWDPVTERFTALPAMTVPRNYHSTALLLPDGRVASIGGGLCGSGCVGNHADLQIFTPYYLLDSNGNPAPRPAITQAADTAAYGSTLTVSTDVPVASFAIVRMSSTTHTVNNDQRRLSVAFTDLGGNRYALAIPSNPGFALPGHYMLFALDAQGVPSVAKTVRIAGDQTPQLTWTGDLVMAAGSAASVQLLASGSGTIRYGATGLPAGLSLDPATGLITGTPTTVGRHPVTINASNAAGSVSTELLWTVNPPAAAVVRYVKFEALSEVNGNPWTSVAEFNLLDGTGAPIPRTGWSVLADSQETVYANVPATSAIDGVATTYWHTQYRTASPPPPHMLVVDLGSAWPVAGFRYLPRQDSSNGRVARWRLHVSDDGIGWRAVTSGTFPNSTAQQQVFPIDIGAANRWPVLEGIANPTAVAGSAVTLDLKAGDADGDALAYGAGNLPPGLTLDAATGRIAGTLDAEGVYVSKVVVSDGRGGTDSAVVTWTVLARTVVVDPIAAPPLGAGGTAAWTVASSAGDGATYSWDFGDGTGTGPGTSATASHAYAAPGLYTVTVTVRDAAGTTGLRRFTQAVYAAAAGSTRATASGALAWQAPASGNPRVWVVNGDGDTVSGFDAVTLARLGEVAVGSAPRAIAVAPGGRLWVTNKASASISVVDPASFGVVQTIALPRASQPHGLAFAPDGSAAYVALEASGLVLRLDPASGATLASLNVGANPRHLAVTPDSARLLVSRFITPPQRGEGTATVATTTLGGTPTGGEVVVVAAAGFAIERTIVLAHSTKADSTVQGRGVPNYLGAAAISPDGTQAWVPAKQDNLQRGLLRDGQNLDFQNTVRAMSARIVLSGWSEDLASRIDHDNASRAAAAAWHPTGAYLFVALPTSRQIAIVDPVSRVELARLEAGRAPDALLVSADGRRLFVSNAMDRTLQAIDLGRLVGYGEWNFATLGTPLAQAREKLSATELLGKQLFHDARDTRLARDGYMSCASCHDDGGHDGRTWDMTGFGEGLRNTVSLRGRAGIGHGRLHWSGNFDEVQDFELQIRNLAGGTGLMDDATLFNGGRDQPLGAAKAGLSADLDALAAYVASLKTMPGSPQRGSTGALTAAASAGRSVFAAQQCATCHGGTGFQAAGALLSDVGTLKPSSGKRLGALLPGLDVPTLRDVASTGPWLHDGSAATLADAVGAHRGVALGATDLANLVAYLGQIGSEEVAAPAVLPAGALRCSAEGANCTLPAGTPATVYYGAGSQWTARGGMTGTLACKNATFGDPAVGAGKSCYYVPAVKCANEGGTCTLATNATLLYGGNGSFHRRAGLSGSVACSSASFGDAAPGAVKACWRQ